MSATDTALAVNRAQTKMIEVRDSRIAALESELSASRAHVATLREALDSIATGTAFGTSGLMDGAGAKAVARTALAATEPRP